MNSPPIKNRLTSSNDYSPSRHLTNNPPHDDDSTMMVLATAPLVIVLLLSLQHPNTIIALPGSSVIVVNAFTILHHGRRHQKIATISAPISKAVSTSTAAATATTTTALSVARYGPQPPLSSPVPEKDSNSDNIKDDDDLSASSSSSSSSTSEVESEWKIKVNHQKDAFRRLIEEAMDVTRGNDPETHLPRLLANNLELIVGLVGGQEGVEVINELLEDAATRGGKDLHDRTLQVVETILSFSEMFVEQAQEMDSQNKHLLGKIIKAMGSAKREVVDGDNKDSQSVGDVWGSDSSSDFIDGSTDSKSREERLDAILEQERHNFTPGFLKHLEGECNRIANAPQMTPESARLLEVVRVIQARVLEEVGKDLGEAALVLGQLMGYENNEELLGVLEAGLTVRGREFGLEMKQHTEEALDGFSSRKDVDPELIDRVTLVDKRLERFLDDTNKFQ